jgi:ribonuclease BN (tRNA processing enzyme)
MRLTVIGCSSGAPSANASTSSYLLETGNKRYLLDCGDGTAAAFTRLGIDVNSIDYICISHMHSDHAMGLPFLIQTMYLLKRTKPLKIYLPREAEDGFKRLFYMTYLFFENLGFEIQFTGVEKGNSFSENNTQIEFHPNTHLQADTNKNYIMQRAIPNRMQCFSMIVISDDKKFVYSADIGSIDDLEQIVDNADLLLTEGMHLDLEQLPQLAIDKNVRKILLTHLQDNTDTDSIRMTFEKNGYSNLDFAQEGLEIDI